MRAERRNDQRLVSGLKVSTCSDRPVLVACDLEGFDHQVDSYIGCEHDCHYCYVLDLAETDWTKEVCVHADIVGQLTAELEGLRPQTIYMGYHSDPYQPCESELRQTRRVLELLVNRGFSASILTKSDLILRDIDLLQEMGDANVAVSVAFVDDAVRRLFEGHTIDTQRRIDALTKLKDAGIGTSALICPVIPHVTEVGSLLAALIPGADVIRVYGLSIRGSSPVCWRNVRDILERRFPDRRRDIESAVLSAEDPYWISLREDLLAEKRERGVDLRVHL